MMGQSFIVIAILGLADNDQSKDDQILSCSWLVKKGGVATAPLCSIIAYVAANVSLANKVSLDSNTWFDKSH